MRGVLVVLQQKLQPPRGMRDYPPSLWQVINMLREKWLKLAEKWGYEPIETPVLEHLWVLERKAGSQVREEIYWFKDKAGRELGLRFDMTVPLARIAASNPQLPKPIRWCYFSRVWRYDEPQYGRWREFWQYGVELIGSPNVEADAEVIALLVESYNAVGINVDVRLFDRRIMDEYLEGIGVEGGIRGRVLGLIDKRWRIGEEAFREELGKLGLKNHVVEDLAKFTSIRRPLKDSINIIADVAPGLRGFYEDLVGLLDAYNILDRIYLDTSIVRGLEYYTGLVFEAYPKSSNEKWNRLAVGGGGRYDELLGLYRKPGAPATGFAIGVDRVVLFLEEHELIENPQTKLDVFVAVKDFSLYKVAVKVASALREKNVKVEVDVMRRSIKEALRYANKKNTRILVYIAPREYSEGKVVVRDLDKREQHVIPLRELPGYIENILRR